MHVCRRLGGFSVGDGSAGAGGRNLWGPVHPSHSCTPIAPLSLLQHDSVMEARVQEADAHGEVLRYIGSYDAESGVCQVGLPVVPGVACCGLLWSAVA